MLKHLRLLVVGIALISGFGLLSPSYYWAKAELAQKLMADAWQETQQSKGQPVKPWPWADTWPVLELTLFKATALEQNQPAAQFVSLAKYIVLADASGESLAFGPGLLTPNLLPGDEGNSIIAAHRDTQFSSLKYIKVGDRIQAKRVDGQSFSFDIDQIEVVDSRNEAPLLESEDHRLTLVTCYPLESKEANPPFRLVVSGRLAKTSSTPQLTIVE